MIGVGRIVSLVFWDMRFYWGFSCGIGLASVRLVQLIKVKTIGRNHVDQLPIEHYWDGEYDFSNKTILGRLNHSGCLLVMDRRKTLHQVAPIAFIDWQLEQNGCRKRVNGKWEYAPTPHTEYSQKARAAYDAIPQLFID